MSDQGQHEGAFQPGGSGAIRPFSASPSRPERLLWTPILFLMAVAALGVGLS
jgi:hypothetical protein